MKKLALISALVMGGLFCNTAYAQIGINLGFHLGSHHNAPIAQIAVEAPIYTETASSNYDYYYLPDVGAYYSIAEQCYYYNDGNNWISAAYLPGYNNYDWRNARHYEVRAHRPYLNDGVYSSRYGGHTGNRNDNRYPQAYANRDFNSGDNRREEQRFDSRGGFNSEERQGQRFGRGENFTRPQPGRNQGNYGQPAIGGRERSNNNGNQPAQNRGQGGHAQSASHGDGQQHFSNNPMHNSGHQGFNRS
jgi:hypothetical protein